VPHLGPISRDRLISALRQIGFQGPYAGGNHQYMVRNAHRVRIPNPHQGDISRSLLAQILKQAGIEHDEWEAT
jgi:predicted RNA binding protein YcfA (HicA-like mRNA interferase family)